MWVLKRFWGFLNWVLTVIVNDDVYLGLLRQHWGLVLAKKEVYFSAIQELRVLFWRAILYSSIICVGWSEFYFFGYVFHVQNLFELCELRERSISLFDLVFLTFLCYFLFWEERYIKFEQKYLFTLDFNRGESRKTNGSYLRWIKWYFSNHG